jgi:hypothetical protein
VKETGDSLHGNNIIMSPLRNGPLVWINKTQNRRSRPGTISSVQRRLLGLSCAASGVSYLPPHPLSDYSKSKKTNSAILNVQENSELRDSLSSHTDIVSPKTTITNNALYTRSGLSFQLSTTVVWTIIQERIFFGNYFKHLLAIKLRMRF